MGARAISVFQHVAPIFLEAFDEDCHNFDESQRQIFFSGHKESRKHVQRRAAASAEVQASLLSSAVLEMELVATSKARLILSSGVIIYMHFVSDEGLNKRDEFSFLIHRTPILDEICQAASGRDGTLLLTGEGKLHLLRWNSTSSGSFPSSCPRESDMQFETFSNLFPSLSSKRVERRLVLNEKNDMFGIWWSTGGDEVFPWNPRPELRANILIYSLSELDEDRPSLIFYTKIEGNLRSVHFLPNGKDLLTVEEASYTPSSGTAELKQTKFDLKSHQKISEVVIPLQNQLKCHEYDSTKEKLSLGLCSASVIISFNEGKITRFTKGAFVPSVLTWHPDGMILMALGSRGQAQMFDIALNPLFFCDHGAWKDPPSLTLQLEPPGAFHHVNWERSETESHLFMQSESGNVSVLKLLMGNMSLPCLVSHHLCARPPAYTEALNVLKSVRWDSEDCKHAAYTLFQRLRLEEYSEAIEGYWDELLEICFNPTIEPDPKIWNLHKKKLILFALSFHHWLLQAHKFKRSLDIAARFRNRQCVRKVHLLALDYGNSSVAAEANGILKTLYSGSASKKHRKHQSTRDRTSDSSTSSSTHKESCSTCSWSDSDADEGENKAGEIALATAQVKLEDRDMPRHADTLECSETEADLALNSSASKITFVCLGDV